MLNNSGLYGPNNQVILLFMCKEWTEAIMLFRYDFKNSDVKCTAVFIISLKWMKVSNRIQTVAIFYHHNLLNFNEPLQFIATGSDCTGGHHW